MKSCGPGANALEKHTTTVPDLPELQQNFWVRTLPFDYIWFPRTELNQRKYGPNMCHVEDRCETGLYGSEMAIQASVV